MDFDFFFPLLRKHKEKNINVFLTTYKPQLILHLFQVQNRDILHANGFETVNGIEILNFEA